MKSRFLFPLIIAVMSLCVVTPHAGAGQKRPKAKPSATPFHVVIESVSADSITVKRSTGDVTYKITKDTEITYQGQTVAASQLQTGMRVEVTPDSFDATVAGAISADVAPAATPSKKTK